MRFKDWIINFEFPHQYLEFQNLEDINTDHIDFKHNEFDEERATQECEDSYETNYDDFENIYESPEDDPDFSAISIDQWMLKNPRPKIEEFDSEEQWQAAVEEWEEEAAEVEEEYDAEIAAWEQEMQEREKRNDEQDSFYRADYIKSCLKEKREEWQEENSDIDYEFNVNGQTFNVYFQNDKETVGMTTVPNVWDVSFTGPDGYSLTYNISGAAAVYSQVIAAIKKLSETEVVNGITFSAADRNMLLVYHRFVKKYLMDQFTMIRPGVFIKNEIVQKFLSELNPELRARFQSMHQQHATDTEDKIAKIRQEKDMIRSAIGKYVGLYNQYTNKTHPGIIIGMANDMVRVLCFNQTPEGPTVTSGNIDMKYINFNYTVDPQTMQLFNSEVQKRHPELSKMVNKYSPSFKVNPQPAVV